ncbi:MAG: hypothetical protein CVU05_00645 [Bacteroidetes bacterium HGW-Bacteroidetes-21]|jgi:desulfoferrodoxin (superoxide reductase-like protein)|nr:MAG: hypothetical protein CVU05_00645 [Bacteroidetes bacterium HGW-Bacteroidetes-21]
MKRGLIFLFVLIVSFPAFAHPPKKITLNADPNTKTLKINVVHPVKDTEAHFISKIQILLNGQEVETLNYTKQTSAAAEIVVYTLDEMKEGDKIEVVANCNKAGQKKASVVVKKYYNQSK